MSQRNAEEIKGVGPFKPLSDISLISTGGSTCKGRGELIILLNALTLLLQLFFQHCPSRLYCICSD